MNPDGRRIADNAGLPRSEIWVMENFLPVAKEPPAAPARQSKS